MDRYGFVVQMKQDGKWIDTNWTNIVNPRQPSGPARLLKEDAQLALNAAQEQYPGAQYRLA